ncbi:MAG: caspase family protein [Saprospiraceae bacterium]|nr:caspase family protein [Saprospiraceae bacterium]
MRKLMILCCICAIAEFAIAGDTCKSGNCSNGLGTLVSDTYTYKGTFLKGQFHGKGKIVFNDKSQYEGAFQNGYIEGVGEYRYSGGHVYKGDFIKNARSGKGTMYYANGDKYKGAWKKDMMHGIGIYSFKDGSEYRGEFKDNVFAGRGMMTMPNGEVLKGIWENNKMIGPDKNQDRSDNTPVNNCNAQYCHETQGTYRYSDGTMYVGHFMNGKPAGKGRVNYSNGSVYIGDWLNGAPHGEGKLTTSTGQIVEGSWLAGRYQKQKTSEPARQSGSMIASSSKKDGKTTIYSLVVGIANYKTMPSLRYTDDDAYQFFAFAKSPEGGAVEDNNISILIDDAATASRIVTELKRITSKADADDEIMVYLSGHGLDGGFVPFDYGEGASVLPYKNLLSIIDESPAKNKICFADACYSGSMAARTTYFAGLEDFYTQLNGSGPGTVLIMSSMNQEVSLEYSGIRQGIFSHFLIKGLKGAANTQKDRIITVEELYSYVSDRVKTYTNHAQNPNIAGNYDPYMPVAFLRQ